MSLKSSIALPYARYQAARIEKASHQALRHQAALLTRLLQLASGTTFGQEHHFHEIQDHAGYRDAVPIRDYEGYRPYIDQIKAGGRDILWAGRPAYFAKTSGTTSGVKYIPLTRESIPEHIRAARNALLCYIAESGQASFVGGKMIFLSGSPELQIVNGIPTGRLSGIVHHHVPAYLTRNRMPSYQTNCIDDWETKLDAIVNETLQQDMRLISGIPPWMQMYFDRLMERSGKKIGELFPHFSVLAHGGVNFEPYRARLMDSIGRPVHTLETYPASEGFIAFQDRMDAEGLLLNTQAGMFFEFVPAEDIFSEKPRRLSLHEVRTGEQYALLISSHAGLWAYNIGDTVRFVSLDPWRIVVTGRIKHFISAFGEHVIAEEVEAALLKACQQFGVRVTEFTVAPFIANAEGASYHEWFVEFETPPEDMQAFSLLTDQALREKNIYYDDLVRGHILQPLRMHAMPAQSFIGFMKQAGKLGGQNKVPRLSNDRNLADPLSLYIHGI